MSVRLHDTSGTPASVPAGPPVTGADLAAIGMLALSPIAPVSASASASASADSDATGTGLEGRSATSLAMQLIRVAERVRCDPPANFDHCAVRGAAQELLHRLEERMASSAGQR